MWKQKNTLVSRTTQNKLCDKLTTSCSSKSCRKAYHAACTQAEHLNSEEKKVWICPDCTVKTKRGDNSHTPCRSTMEKAVQKIETQQPRPGVKAGGAGVTTSDAPATYSTPADRSSPPASPKHGHNEISREVITYSQLEKLLESKFSQLSRQLKDEYNSSIERLKAEFTQTTDYLAEQIADLRNDFECMKKNYALVSSTVTALEQENAYLRCNLNDREQAEYLNDVELSGVPEYKGESPVNITVAVATKLGVTLEAQDIVSANRVGEVTKRRDDGLPSRSRRLVVRFSRREPRDQLLKAGRVRRGVNTDDIGLPKHNPAPVYINERLTTLNRRLLGKAREAKRSLGWKYVWSSEGRILARREEGSKVQLIKTEKDLVRVFGPGVDLSRNA